jgi:hypothetical protein
LITNSNLVDCITGRSAGFSPAEERDEFAPNHSITSSAVPPTLLARADEVIE